MRSYNVILGINTIPQMAQQSIRGLLQYAINTGYENATRVYLANNAQTLLDNPETAHIVVNAFSAVGRHI